MITHAKSFRWWGTVAVIAAVLISSLSFTVHSAGAQAQDPQQSITMSPSAKKYQLNAGQVKSDTLTVLNDGQTAYDFTMYATPYWIKDSSYQPDFSSDNPRADAYAWISFEKSRYHAEPRETITIPYTITVPEDVAPGGHYAIVFAEVQPPEGTDANLVIKKRVGTIVYASTTGDVQLAGKTTSLSVPWFQPAAPMAAHATVENTGNSNFTVTTKLTVSDIFGNVKADINNQYETLPGTTRNITMQWQHSPWFGLYKVQATSTVLGDTTTASSFVLVMPYWMILLLIGIVIAGVAYALKRQKRQQKTSEEQ